MFAVMGQIGWAWPWSLYAPPLAQQASYVEWARRFRQGGADHVWSDALLLATIVAVTGATLWLLVRTFNRKETVGNDPARLFRGLCRVHGLGRQDQRLLRQLAQWHELAHPARLFLEPERFDAARFAAADVEQRQRLLLLRDTLFARRLTEAKEDAES